MQVNGTQILIFQIMSKSRPKNQQSNLNELHIHFLDRLLKNDLAS